MNEIVNIHNVSLKYQSQNGEIEALSDINFSVNLGEHVCIVGPSGCGKSTLLSIIAGLIMPSSGEVTIQGLSLIHIFYHPISCHTVGGNHFSLRLGKQIVPKLACIRDNLINIRDCLVYTS